MLDRHIYNDHHDYTRQDIKDIYEQAKYLQAEVILTTQKDWVKAAPFAWDDEDITFAYLALELDFIEGSDTIETMVDKLLEKR